MGVGDHLWWPRPRFELELLGLGVAGGEQIGARLAEAAQVPCVSVEGVPEEQEVDEVACPEIGSVGWLVGIGAGVEDVYKRQAEG